MLLLLKKREIKQCRPTGLLLVCFQGNFFFYYYLPYKYFDIHVKVELYFFGPLVACNEGSWFAFIVLLLLQKSKWHVTRICFFGTVNCKFSYYLLIVILQVESWYSLIPGATYQLCTSEWSTCEPTVLSLLSRSLICFLNICRY